MGKNLIIQGADFSENAVPVPFILANNIVVAGGVGVGATLRKGQLIRSTLLRNAVSNTLWETDQTNDNPDKANYALNPIPAYAKKIKVTYSGVVLSIGIFDAEYKSCRYPNWSGADGVQELDLTTLHGATFFSTNFQTTNIYLPDVKVEFSF